MLPELGSTIVVAPERLVAGGDSLSRIDGFPVFVPSLYPGDRALVRITERKKGFGRGEVVELLDPSPLRRAEPCPIAATCGGCDWTSLRLDAQLDAKREILLDSLRRVGKFDAATLPPVAIHPSPLNYRLRSRLHRSHDALGFYALRSRDVVPLVPQCEVVGPEVLAYLGELPDIVEPGESVVTFETPDTFAAAPESDAGRHELSIAAGGYDYRVSLSSFFQVNRHLLTKMITLVTTSARTCENRRTALDLYGGAGFFALPLGAIFDEVVTVEDNAASHRYARMNAKSSPAVRAVRDDVARFLTREVHADFTFVDPPRAGLAPEVVERIAGVTGERICHLSCDPVTFARDASRLARRGWTLASLDLVDLFPNTHHIETLASFTRDGRTK